MSNPFRQVLNDFGFCPFNSQGRYSAAAVLLAVMADNFDAHPEAVTSPNPYRHVFDALSKYSTSEFVKQLRQDLNSKVEA